MSNVKIFDCVFFLIILSYYAILLIKLYKKVSKAVTLGTVFNLLIVVFLSIIIFTMIELSYAP